MSAAGIPNQQTTNYVNGELVEPSDLLNDQTSAQSTAREIWLCLAGSGSVKPLYNFLDFAFTTNGSGQLVVSVTNAQLWVMTQSYMCDSYDAAGSTTMPAVIGPSGSTRVDGLYIKPVTNSVNGPLRTVKNNDGTENSAYQLTYDVIQYQVKYIAGTDGSSSPPATPAGWELYASFGVSGSTAPVNYQILYSTLRRLLNGVEGYPVQSVNGHVGAIGLAAGNGLTLHDLGSGSLRVDGISFNAPNAVTAAYTGTDSNGNNIITLAVPILDGGHYIQSVNGHQGLIVLSAGNLNTLHDLGSGNIRIDTFSINAPNAVTATVTGTDSNGNNIITLAVPILDGGNFVSAVNGHHGAITLSTGNFGTLHDLGGGALRVDPPSILGSPSIAITNPGTDSNGNPIIQFGSPVVVMRKYMNYSLVAFTPGSLGTTPASYVDVLTNLGGFLHSSPISSNQEIRLACEITCAEGTPVGGVFHSNADFYWFINGTYEGTIAASLTAQQNFSTVLHAGTHTIILQFHSGSDPAYIDLGVWIAASGVFLNTGLVSAIGPA